MNTTCDQESTDPDKHVGPFEVLQVTEYSRFGSVSQEKCLHCGVDILRPLPIAADPANTNSAKPVLS